MSAIPARNFEAEFGSWEPRFERYRRLLKQRKKTPSLYQAVFQIEKFWEWLRQKSTLPTELVPYHFLCYSRDLHSSDLCLEVDSYSPGTISIFLGAAICWTRYLTKQGVLLQDPFREFQPNHPRKNLYPRSLTIAQVKQILSHPDTTSPLGLRERAILEVIYGSGLRCKEALSLTLESIDFERRLFYLRNTKNGWDRVIPFTRPAKQYIIRYLEEARPSLQGPRSGRALWLNKHKRPLGQQAMIYLAARLSDDLGFKFTTHSLRHACATHLLEGGANIRAIAELLGHSDLGSTSHYAKVRVEELKRVHGLAHPRA